MKELKQRNHFKKFEEVELETTKGSEREDRSITTSRYGNMIVIFSNNRFLLTLGPNYCCFLFTFISLFILEVFSIKTVFSYFGNSLISWIFMIGAFLQQLSYVLVAISDPGIVRPNDEFVGVQQQQIKRICKICNKEMAKTTQHCRQCNVCIRGYDHHCPYTSKCIGQNNLGRFYLFSGLSMTYMILCIVMLCVYH